MGVGMLILGAMDLGVTFLNGCRSGRISSLGLIIGVILIFMGLQMLL